MALLPVEKSSQTQKAEMVCLSGGTLVGQALALMFGKAASSASRGRVSLSVEIVCSFGIWVVYRFRWSLCLHRSPWAKATGLRSDAG